VASVRSAITGDILPMEVFVDDTVKSLRKRISCALNVHAWEVSLVNDMHVLNDDAELPWIRPTAGPMCCTLTFLVQAVDLRGIMMAMEVACKDWCEETVGEDIQNVFLCMSTPCLVGDDYVATMRFTYASRELADSHVDEAIIEYDMHRDRVVRIRT
jgi:hypothetical protein